MPKYRFIICEHCNKSISRGSIVYAHNPLHFGFHHVHQLNIVTEETQSLDSTIYGILETRQKINSHVKVTLGREADLTLFEGIRYVFVHCVQHQLFSTFISTLINYTLNTLCMNNLMKEYHGVMPSDFLIITSTLLDISFSIIGLSAATKGIVGIINKTLPEFPRCTCCTHPQLEQPGCTPHCTLCGLNEEGKDWSHGSNEKHCLKVCQDCAIRCDNTAIDYKHQDASEIDTHLPFSIQSNKAYWCCALLSHSFIITGILLSFLPGGGGYFRMLLMAGSLGINITLRLLVERAVTIGCDSCSTTGYIDTFDFLNGCQKWSTCCRVRKDAEKL